MKLYVVQNSEGKFFRPRGYGGYGDQWQVSLEKAKFYPKIGTAKSQCTFWYNFNPKFGCPKVLEFEFDVASAKLIDVFEQVQVSVNKKAAKQAKRDAEQKLYEQTRNMSKIKEIMNTLTAEQKAQLKL